MLTEQQLSLLRIAEIEYNNKPSLLYKTYNNTRTCVIVVDMIVGYCESGALSSKEAATLVTPIATMLDFLPAAQKVFIQDKHTEQSAELRSKPSHCVLAREGAVVKPLLRFAKNSIYKNSDNPLFGLLENIKPNAFDNYIIVGCYADTSVLQLALSLKAYLNECNLIGNVIALTDFVATQHSAEHDSGLYAMYAYLLMEQAGVSVFKNLK